MKKINLIILFCLVISLSAELSVYVDVNRFLDESLNTTYTINYEIPYSSMKFIPTKYGYGAQIDVEFTIKKGEKKRTQTFSNNIILTEFYKTVSDENYLDRLTITLSKPDYSIELNFTDVKSNESRNWKYPFEQLSANSVISDIEFSNNVIIDTTNYLDKFHRGDKLYLVNTSHIFTNEEINDFYLYYEYYNPEMKSKALEETIIISKNDKIIQEMNTQVNLSNIINPIVRLIDVNKLDPALYSLKVIIDTGTEKIEQIDNFSIKKETYYYIRFFDDDQKDIELVKIFLNSTEKSAFSDLTNTEKIKYIDRFWKSKDPNPATEENEIIMTIRSRINDANKRFGYFKNEGWETDRGRIYIKHGEPDELVKSNTNIYNTDVTDDTPKLYYTTAGTKDFHVWKYRSNHYETYIFIDLYNNKGFKLIYAGNDDSEVTLANWRDYVGGDEFDESLLD